jgi:hypothetical protein
VTACLASGGCCGKWWAGGSRSGETAAEARRVRRWPKHDGQASGQSTMVGPADEMAAKVHGSVVAEAQWRPSETSD